MRYELLSRQETKRLLDRLGESHPKLCEELVPKVMSLGEVQKVLQQLLREQVSIRDLPTILESLLDTAPASRNPVLLVEAARQATGPGSGTSAALRRRRPAGGDARSRDRGGARPALSPAQAPRGRSSLKPAFVQHLLDGLKKLVGEQVRMATPVLFCSTPARFHLRRLLEPFLPKVVVLSPGEIPPVVQVQFAGNAFDEEDA